MPSYGLTKRYTRCLLLAVVSCFVFPVLLHYREAVRIYFTDQLPPLYEDCRKREQNLEHYKEYEMSKDVKYLWSAKHADKSGWGNVMQDYVMNALLAHDTGRSFVFDDYVWNPDGSLFSHYNGHLIPSRIPPDSIIGRQVQHSVVVGGEMPPGDTTPRAVSKDFFNKVCPHPTVVQVTEVNDGGIPFDESVPVSYIFEKWLQKINSIEDPCVEIDSDPGPESHPVFEYLIFGQERMLSIWKYLKDSPVLTHWRWSPLIHDAYRQNRHIFEGLSGSAVTEKYTDPIPGLLALHVRRGDFQDHCVHLGKWSSNWNAFNMFPEFSDRFQRPTDGGWGETSEKNMQMYMQRCFPTIDQIVEKVVQVRVKSEQPLTHIYIMTNGAVAWVEELKEALWNSGDWDQIQSSRDLDITWEQKFVVQALDMLVAQRSEVLIGNGWSSLTSNVVMLRMAQGFTPDSNRFW